jgi:hypothetical protein
MGERRSVYRVLVGKRNVGSMDCIELAQDIDRWLALVKAVMGSIKCGEFLGYLKTG